MGSPSDISSQVSVVQLICVLFIAALMLFYNDIVASVSFFIGNPIYIKSSIDNGFPLIPDDAISNTGTHSYPYLAGFTTFACLLITFIMICLYAYKAG